MAKEEQGRSASRGREIGIADALASRAVGQQLPKWSGKQYPCAELRGSRQSSFRIGRSVVRLIDVLVLI